MKKQSLLFIFTFLSGIAFAQSKSGFGLRAGLTYTEMKGGAVNSLKDLLDFTNGMVTTSGRTGFFAGGYASVPVTSEISLEPGIFYSQKGYNINGEFNLKGLEFLGANASAKLQSQFIDVPVVLKANLGGLQLFAGPEISYLAKADLQTKAGILGFNLFNKSMDVTSQFNRWDVGITGGIGYQFSNGMNITGSYNHGLSKVDANNNFDAYNRGFKLGLGINF